MIPRVASLKSVTLLSTSILPFIGLIKPMIKSIIVDFPEPVIPVMPMLEPRFISRFIFFNRYPSCPL